MFHSDLDDHLLQRHMGIQEPSVWAMLKRWFRAC